MLMSKVLLGIRVLSYMNQGSGDVLIKSTDIATDCYMSHSNTEQILSTLVVGKFIRGFRGAGGGYELLRFDGVTLGEICLAFGYLPEKIYSEAFLNTLVSEVLK